MVSAAVKEALGIEEGKPSGKPVARVADSAVGALGAKDENVDFILDGAFGARKA